MPFTPSGALMVLREPTITVREKEVVDATAPKTSGSPLGVVWKLSAVVCGSRRRVWLLLSPPESVAVRVSCRYDGKA